MHWTAFFLFTEKRNMKYRTTHLTCSTSLVVQQHSLAQYRLKILCKHISILNKQFQHINKQDRQHTQPRILTGSYLVVTRLFTMC